MYYDDVLRALNAKKVKYAVAGGLAVILHGYPRLTLDLDLIVDFSEDNLDKFFTTMENLGYRPKAPVKKEAFKKRDNHKKWIKEKNMVVFSFFHLKDHLKAIDMFITEPIKFSEIEKHAVSINVGGNLKIKTISIDHLLKLKKLASRQKDLLDIRNLEEIKKIKNEKKR